MNLASALVDTGTHLIDKFITSDAEKLAAHAELLKITQSGALAQMEVNAVEAQHRSLFVAGWRPFIGWVCGAAFAYSFVLQPFMVFIAWVLSLYNVSTFDTTMLPSLNMGELIAVLGGILGLGGLRTREKEKGVTR